MVHDFSKPLDLGRTFELITCIEVVEHLLEEDALVLLDTITNMASKYIYFSSDAYTIESAEEPTHINMQEEKYWVEQFEKRGFVKYEYFPACRSVPHAILFLNKEILK